jgi:hypothetical protein
MKAGRLVGLWAGWSVTVLVFQRAGFLYVHMQQQQSKNGTYTVKRVDEVVRHPHLVTQDQFTQLSKKVFDIPAEDFTINIELFLHSFTNVELVGQNWFVSKATSPGPEPRYSDLHSDTLPLRHTLFPF